MEIVKSTVNGDPRVVQKGSHHNCPRPSKKIARCQQHPWIKAVSVDSKAFTLIQRPKPLLPLVLSKANQTQPSRIERLVFCANVETGVHNIFLFPPENLGYRRCMLAQQGATKPIECIVVQQMGNRSRKCINMLVSERFCMAEREEATSTETAGCIWRKVCWGETDPPRSTAREKVSTVAST
jgi:hypothetical protein